MNTSDRIAALDRIQRYLEQVVIENEPNLGNRLGGLPWNDLRGLYLLCQDAKAYLKENN